MKLKSTTRVCELCNADAASYCPSDSAFLCCTCDAKVHGANFLVARHLRHALCSRCKAFTGICFAGTGGGVGFRSPSSCCCGDQQEDALSASSSDSACISSTHSCCITPPEKPIDFDTTGVSSSSVTSVNISGGKPELPPVTAGNTRKTERKSNVVVVVDLKMKSEVILLNWCRKLGVGVRDSDRSVVRMASRALGVCLTQFTVLPFRACLAASLWYSLRICGGDSSGSTWQTLRKLELISGLPAKLIMVAEARLSRILKLQRRQRRQLSPDQLQEGWAECSS